VTGSNAVDAAEESTNSPRSKARRHLNTWFAFSPCARATNATLAPAPTSDLQSAASPQPSAICGPDVPHLMPDP